MATIGSPLRAIRAKCMDCTCQQIVEVRECTATDCPIHPFRMGKNPNRAGKGGNTAGLEKARSLKNNTDSRRDSEALVV